MLTESTPTSRSASEPRRTAAKQPSGMPSSADQPMLAAISASVKGSCSITVTQHRAVGQHVGAEIAGDDAAEEARDLHDDRLVEAHRDAERSRMAGVASGPSSTAAGSPGMSWIMLISMISATAVMMTASPVRFTA